ncbi:hypothetical protein BC833DRAFT_602197 [Globomyces pollinis-pini]|nr:hypothetical protein BC833DRAFT_602197 [Globomyces pollinis-pini]
MNSILKDTNQRISHDFQSKLFLKPTYCDYCSKLFTKNVNQGVCCKECLYNAHEDCIKLITRPCHPIMIESLTRRKTVNQPSTNDPIAEQITMESPKKKGLPKLSVKIKSVDSLEELDMTQLNLNAPNVTGSKTKHSFQTVSFSNPTYCDLCSTFIWGLVKQGLACSGNICIKITLDCGYICHRKCEYYIHSSCSMKNGNHKKTSSNATRVNSLVSTIGRKSTSKKPTFFGIEFN